MARIEIEYLDNFLPLKSMNSNAPEIS